MQESTQQFKYLGRKRENRQQSQKLRSGITYRTPTGVWSKRAVRKKSLRAAAPARVVTLDGEEAQPHAELRPSSYKEKQYAVRQDTVIPDLLNPYAELLSTTLGLATLREAKTQQLRCEGCNRGKTPPVHVLCLYFDHGMRMLYSKCSIHIKLTYAIGYEQRVVCTCSVEGATEDISSVAVQLLNVGLFGCAPQRPSLAIDIDLLDFTRLLFGHIAPNTTGFTRAIEEFLESRQYTVGTEVRI